MLWNCWHVWWKEVLGLVTKEDVNKSCVCSFIFWGPTWWNYVFFNRLASLFVVCWKDILRWRSFLFLVATCDSFAWILTDFYDWLIAYSDKFNFFLIQEVTLAVFNLPGTYSADSRMAGVLDIIFSPLSS